MRASRREVLAGGAALPVAASAAVSVPATALDQVERDLARYIGFGVKASGGVGDGASGAWLEGELQTIGYKVERQPMDVPFFEVEQATLTSGHARATVLPQAIVVPTAAGGLTGPLVRVAPGGTADRPPAGAIALIDLPFARHSSALAKGIKGPVDAAIAAGAKAVVLVTNGPTGKAIALNAEGSRPMFATPVAVIAPADAVPILAAAQRGETGTLTVTGRGGRRPAFNLIGRLDRGHGRWLAVSTPRSGWFTCAGERGPGIAVWLWLARWAARNARDHDLAFICNSGHEFENLGSEHALATAAPKPVDTALWLHLGANVAARDWHDGTPTWTPLPSADPQRYLVVTPDLMEGARRSFAGQPGLEAVYPSSAFTAGELSNVLKAGYRSVAGVFGAHRFHHVREDDARCVTPAPVAAAAMAFQTLAEQALARR